MEYKITRKESGLAVSIFNVNKVNYVDVINAVADLTQSHLKVILYGVCDKELKFFVSETSEAEKPYTMMLVDTLLKNI